MVELSRKIVLTAGAAFFAASAFGQVPTRDINVQTGQAAGQSTNFNLQILEEVDALRREITELRETIDQQRYETGQFRRDNAEAITELQRELDYRTAQPAAPVGPDGEFSGEQGSGSTAFAVGGGGAGDPSNGGVSSAPPAGSPPPASTLDANTEEILSNLYDGAVPESGAGSTTPAAVTGDASPPTGIAGPEQAQLRAEQAQFRAEQAQLLEAQARFLLEQARFRQEQSQFLQQQDGGGAEPRTAPQGQTPDPQSSNQQPGLQQRQQQGQPPVPAPDQGAVVLPGIDDAAGTEVRIGPAPIVAGTISMDQGPNPEPAGDSAPYVPADIAIPAEPSLEMVIIDNEPAPLDEFTPTPTTPRTAQNELVNPFDLNEAASTERGASVSSL